MTNPMKDFEGSSIGGGQEWWRMDEESEKMHGMFWLVWNWC